MTELRVYDLLNEIGESNLGKATDRSRLLPEYVNNTCRTITNILYDTLEGESSATRTRRSNIIHLIRKQLCLKDGTHLSLDSSNCDCFLKCIKTKRDCDDLDTFLSDELELGDCNFSAGNDVDSVVHFYKEYDEKRAERKRRIEGIVEFDQTLLRDIDFTIAPILNVVKKTIVFDDDKITAAERTDRQDKRIALIYALLNLPRNEYVGAVLMSSLKDVVNGDTQLFEYVYTKADEALQLQLLKRYPFIYEVALVRTTRHEMLRPGSLRCDEVVARIIKLSAENPWLKTKIVSLLYELFALSNYNENLLTIINNF